MEGSGGALTSGVRNTYPPSVCLLIPALLATEVFICNAAGPGERGVEFHSYIEEIRQTKAAMR